MKPFRHVRSLALVLVVAAVAATAFTASATGAGGPAPDTAPPTITGTAKAGETLTATPGTWATPPTSVAYHWQRCSDAGTAVRRHRRRDRRRRTSRPRPTSATPTASSPPRPMPAARPTAPPPSTAVIVSGAAPQNTAPPTVSGTTTEGQTLVGTDGTWAGAAHDRLHLRLVALRRDGRRRASPITGATAKTYVLAAADVDKTLRLAVTAKNALGSETEITGPTAQIARARTGQRRHAALGRQVDRRDRRQVAGAARDRQGVVLAQPAALAGRVHGQDPRLRHARLRGAQRARVRRRASRSAARRRRPRSRPAPTARRR